MWSTFHKLYKGGLVVCAGAGVDVTVQLIVFLFILKNSVLECL